MVTNKLTTSDVHLIHDNILCPWSPYPVLSYATLAGPEPAIPQVLYNSFLADIYPINYLVVETLYLDF